MTEDRGTFKTIHPSIRPIVGICDVPSTTWQKLLPQMRAFRSLCHLRQGSLTNAERRLRYPRIGPFSLEKNISGRPRPLWLQGPVASRLRFLFAAVYLFLSSSSVSARPLFCGARMRNLPPMRAGARHPSRLWRNAGAGHATGRAATDAAEGHRSSACDDPASPPAPAGIRPSRKRA